MPASVVDASAIGAVAFQEPEAAEVLQRLADDELIAPALLPFELANVAWKKSRRRPETETLVSNQLDRVLRMRFTWVEADHSAVFQLAAQRGVSAYDASYLWVARWSGLRLVTLDRRLEAVARGMGLS